MHQNNERAERREDKLDARLRGMDVKEYAKYKEGNLKKLNEENDIRSAYPIPLPEALKPTKNIEIKVKSWQEYPTFRAFLMAAYSKASDNNAKEKAFKLRNYIFNAFGDNRISLTNDSRIVFKDGVLKLYGVHSDKFGKNLEDIALEPLRNEKAKVAGSARAKEAKLAGDVRQTITNRGGEYRVVKGGAPSSYRPSADGFVNRSGVWTQELPDAINKLHGKSLKNAFLYTLRHNPNFNDKRVSIAEKSLGEIDVLVALKDGKEFRFNVQVNDNKFELSKNDGKYLADPSQGDDSNAYSFELNDMGLVQGAIREEIDRQANS